MREVAGLLDNVFDGGVGYGSTWAHSDLSNTHLAMEALYYAKKTFPSKEEVEMELDWDAAIAFVSKCQNLKSSNDEEWVSDEDEDVGGFIYFPGNSMAGDRVLDNGSDNFGCVCVSGSNDGGGFCFFQRSVGARYCSRRRG